MTGEQQGCGRADCFACGLTGMGFDDDMVTLVLQLMSRAYIAGGARATTDLIGPIAGFRYGLARDASGSLGISGDEVVRCYESVMARRSMPMSPDVAEAARHRG